MNWYYESGGQQQGPVADSELDRLLAEGKITLDTLVWREGLASWTPLRTARAAAPPVPPGAPPVDAGWEVTRPAGSVSPVAPAGSEAAGSDYPQPGWIRCSLTGRYFPPSEIIYLEGKPYSAAAKPQVVASLQSGGALPISTVGREGPDWERRDQLGLWKALVGTTKSIFGEPVRVFNTMKQTGGLGSPLLYWLLTGGIGIAVGQVYGLFMQGAMLGAMSQAGMSGSQMGAMGMQAAVGAGSIVIMPIVFIIALFIQAGLTHLTLMMLKGANQPFETTFRVAAYAFGATGTLHLIPMCGSMVAGLWGLIVFCAGLGPAHQTSTGKGVAAVLIPFGVCCLMTVGLYAVIIGGIVAATQGAGQGVSH